MERKYWVISYEGTAANADDRCLNPETGTWGLGIYHFPNAEAAQRAAENAPKRGIVSLQPCFCNDCHDEIQRAARTFSALAATR